MKRVQKTNGFRFASVRTLAVLILSVGGFALLLGGCGTFSSEPTEPPLSQRTTPTAYERLLYETRVFSTVAGIVSGKAVPESNLDTLVETPDPKAAETLRSKAMQTIAESVDTKWRLKPVYVVLNALPWNRSGLVTIDVTDYLGTEPFKNVCAQDYDGMYLPSQLIELPGPRYSLTFVSPYIPAWGWAVYSVQKDVALPEGGLATTLTARALPSGEHAFGSPVLRIAARSHWEKMAIADMIGPRNLLADEGIWLGFKPSQGQSTPLQAKGTTAFRGATSPVSVDLHLDFETPFGTLGSSLIMYDRSPWFELDFDLPENAQADGQVVTKLLTGMDLIQGAEGAEVHGPGWLDVSDPTGGFTILHDSETQVWLGAKHVEIRLPVKHGDRRVALLPHGTQISKSQLTRRAMEFVYPLRPVQTDDHFGSYHPSYIRLEMRTKDDYRIYPMMQVEPENVTIENPRINAHGELVLELVELEGRGSEAVVHLVSNVVRVDGRVRDATNTVSIPIDGNTRETVRFAF